MIDYAAVKSVHVAAVAVSAVGFLARGWGRLTGAGWMDARAVKVLPHVVDTVLLASALTLAFLLQPDPWNLPWIRVKVMALVAYVLLGRLALSGSRRAGARAAAFLAAVAVLAFIFSVALTKRPSGLFGA